MHICLVPQFEREKNLKFSHNPSKQKSVVRGVLLDLSSYQLPFSWGYGLTSVIHHDHNNYVHKGCVMLGLA